MARVTRVPNGYEFSGLSGIGMRLVNEFQRQFPMQCVPSSEPNHRVIHLGSPVQNRFLEKLVAEVRARDPEPTPPQFKTRA
jgi:hypothetical protein